MKICAINRIDYDGKTFDPKEEFECRKEAAERLISLGVAGLPQPKLESATVETATDNAEAELIGKIKLAESLEVLLEMAPENPSQEVSAAIGARVEELEAEEGSGAGN